MGQIFVRVQMDDYPGAMDREIAVPLESAKFYEFSPMFPLKFPNPDAGAIGRMFCTDDATVQRVLRSREVISKALSRQLTDAILDALGAKDTVDGDPKKQWMKDHGWAE